MADASIQNQKIGNRIRERRKALSFPPKEFARHIGVSPQQLQKYETGENRVSAVTLEKIAAILRVDLKYFYKEEAPHLPFGPALTSSFRAAEILNQPETKNLVKGFIAIENTRVRTAVVELVTSITKCFAKKVS